MTRETLKLVKTIDNLEHLAQTLFTALETTAKSLEDADNLPDCAYEAIRQGREFGLKEANGNE